MKVMLTVIIIVACFQLPDSASSQQSNDSGKTAVSPRAVTSAVDSTLRVRLERPRSTLGQSIYLLRVSHRALIDQYLKSPILLDPQASLGYRFLISDAERTTHHAPWKFEFDTFKSYFVREMPCCGRTYYQTTDRFHAGQPFGKHPGP
jgi:hypothetical protein